MAKEIERKYLIVSGYYESMLEHFKYKDILYDDIRDYYFNDTTRLRIKNESSYTITVKSKEFLCRDEHEFQVKSNVKDYDVMRTLNKRRYFYPHEGHIFEINIFENIMHPTPHGFEPLILIEVELQKDDEEVLVPPWIGEEVTYNSNYYNASLFNRHCIF